MKGEGLPKQAKQKKSFPFHSEVPPQHCTHCKWADVSLCTHSTVQLLPESLQKFINISGFDLIFLLIKSCKLYRPAPPAPIYVAQEVGNTGNW